MFNLFEGLESLGFGKTNVPFEDLYKKDTKSNKNDEKILSPANKKVLQPEDFVYLKETVCTACDKSFYYVTTKFRKARLIKTDTDLRPYFHPIEPLYYDVIMCNHCGYTAISSMFPRLTERQAEKIKIGITTKFKYKEYPLILTPDDAIERYKFALLNCLVKESKAGEKAYICLKIAWIYRAKPDQKNELIFLRNAFAGFEKALQEERLPICGIEESTLIYILADIARRLGDFTTALRYVSSIIMSSNTPKKIKERAITLKQMIREEQNNG